jgi:hypothetical protein
MNEGTLRQLDRIVKRHDTATSAEIAAALQQQHGVRVSPRSVRRARRGPLGRHPVHEHIARSLTPGDMTRRLNFARAHLTNNFRFVLFSDEKLWYLSRTGRVHWVKIGEQPHAREVADPRVTVMAWGCVWWSGKTTLHTTSKTIDADHYTHILSTHLLPIMPTGSRYRFQHDNASPHTSTKTKNFLTQYNVNLLQDWPAWSPDFSVMDYVWSWISKYVNSQAPRDRASLKRAIRSGWEELSQHVIQQYIDHVCAVIKRVAAGNGDYV